MPNIDQVQLPDGSQYNLRDNISGYVTAQYVNDAIDGLTKANVGLGNVDNTSDLNKPVSTAQQTALNGKTNTTVIAPTEATTTASRRYEIGEQFILNGVLYTATAVIASGDSIIVNTNCDLSESITEQIDGKAEKTDLTSISERGTTASQAISAGTYFYLNGTLVRAKTAIASGATFTLNTNYEVVSDGALNKPLKYSTEEYVIGTWIDGSTLYEKTISVSASASPQSGRATCDMILQEGISQLVNAEGYVYLRQSNVYSNQGLMLGYVAVGSSGQVAQQASIYFQNNKAVVRVQTYGDSTFDGAKATVTLRYTKTS